MRMAWKFALSFAAVLFAVSIVVASQVRPAVPIDSAVVKIILDAGHGSGVHIGDGYILTAAHVASKGEVTIKSSRGDIRPGSVLWSNAEYDIALIRTEPTRLGIAELTCSDLSNGQVIVAEGNPLDLEFISTSGRVAGTARSAGAWKLVYPVDVTILPGMSGGPIFDTSGRVAGIGVGVMTAPLGISASFTGVGVIVPSTVVCELLAR